jgi:hypothetical protein
MNKSLLFICVLLAVAHGYDYSKALDDYLNKEEEVYNWYYTGESFKTLLGADAYVINVTS